jgi:hypothetical protein
VAGFLDRIVGDESLDCVAARRTTEKERRHKFMVLNAATRGSRSLSSGSVVVAGTQGNPVSNDLDDPDDDGPDLPWRRMAFFAVLGLGLVAVIVYLYVLATGH